MAAAAPPTDSGSSESGDGGTSVGEGMPLRYVLSCARACACIACGLGCEKYEDDGCVRSGSTKGESGMPGPSVGMWCGRFGRTRKYECRLGCESGDGVCECGVLGAGDGESVEPDCADEHEPWRGSAWGGSGKPSSASDMKSLVTESGVPSGDGTRSGDASGVGRWFGLPGGFSSESEAEASRESLPDLAPSAGELGSVGVGGISEKMEGVVPVVDDGGGEAVGAEASKSGKKLMLNRLGGGGGGGVAGGDGGSTVGSGGGGLCGVGDSIGGEVGVLAAGDSGNRGTRLTGT
jgi:hypothetical protein